MAFSGSPNEKCKESCSYILFAYKCFLLIGTRVVGGLLSAYDLSGDKVFLDKARDIADRLLPAWDTPSGIPYNFINLVNGRPHNPSWTGVSFVNFFSFCRFSSFPINVSEKHIHVRSLTMVVATYISFTGSEMAFNSKLAC